jgi:hypothetical protein
MEALLTIGSIGFALVVTFWAGVNVGQSEWRRHKSWVRDYLR